MPGGLMALLDDVAVIARAAAASIDDVGIAAGRAGSKAAGVVIDDAAVTPSYVTGFTPDRELPIIAKITRGSLKNKLLILLPAALLLSAFLPWAITATSSSRAISPPGTSHPPLRPAGYSKTVEQPTGAAQGRCLHVTRWCRPRRPGGRACQRPHGLHEVQTLVNIWRSRIQ